MSRLQFTPWKDHSELVELRDQFYPPPEYVGPDMRKRACSLVSVWKVRGSLPHAVEATAHITSAILHDDPAKHSVYSIRATYSTAFCRFVTALVDRSVHGRKQTMYHLAGELGIPSSFVELRHEATHRDMPSLITLQRASQRALEWLWQYYWAGVEDTTSSLLTKGGGGDSVGSDDGAFRPQDIQLIKDEIRKLIEPVIQRAGGPSLPIRERRAFERQVALPLAKELANTCSRSRGAGFVAQVLLEEGVTLPKSSSADDQTSVMVQTWEPVLTTLSRHHPVFLTTFVDEAVSILVSQSPPDKEEPEPYHEGIYVWLDRIVRSADSWADLRGTFLVLSYAQAVCAENKGYWARRVQDLVGRLPIPAQSSSGDELKTSEVNGNGITASRQSRVQSEDLDVTALREYGWNFNPSRASRPIGIAL